MVAEAAELMPFAVVRERVQLSSSWCELTYVKAQGAPDAKSDIAVEHASDRGVEYASGGSDVDGS